MNFKSVIGLGCLCVVLATFLWSSVPRLINEFRHVHDFVPAQGQRITSYKCTNWNGGMWSECTVSFSASQNEKPREITDWRFLSAPAGPVRLLQLGTDASSVTTDVSLETSGNRLALALMVGLFGGLAAGLLFARAMKSTDPQGRPLYS